MAAGTFVNDLNDTIVAVASARAVAERGIVRLSGPAVLDLVARCFEPDPPGPWPPQRARRLRGRLHLADAGRPPATLGVDLWVWPTCQTYTGQPSAEFHLPGLPYLMEQAVQQCLRLGARIAAPGEFTLRAFLAGRLDLLQAQAVLRLIEAQDPNQLQLALTQLAGGLSTPLQRLREQLIAVLAHLEAGLDFVDEDIEFISRSQLLLDLTGVCQQVSAMVEQLRQRREIGRLPRVVLVGPPNAGKSSLFNALLRQDLAIVSPLPGTTRDYLSGRLRLGDQDIELIDTAGLDQQLQHLALAAATDPDQPSAGQDLDRMSQEQAWALLPTADVVVLCWDATQSDRWIEYWLSLLPKLPALLVLGKADLASPATAANRSGLVTRIAGRLPMAWVSTQTGQGMAELRCALPATLNRVAAPGESESQLLSARSLEDLEQIEVALREAIAIADSGGGEELVAAELHRAIERLGRLVGTIYTDDILDSIFSRFCIGK